MITASFKGQLTFPIDSEEENKWVEATLSRITPLVSIPKNQDRKDLRNCVAAILANSVASYRQEGLSNWVQYPRDKNLDALHNSENTYSRELLRRTIEALREAEILEDLKTSALNTFESQQVAYKVHENELEKYALSGHAEPYEYWNKPVVMRTKKRRYLKGGEQKAWRIPIPLPNSGEAEILIEEVLAYRGLLASHSITPDKDSKYSDSFKELSGRWLAGSVRRIYTHPEWIPQNEEVGFNYNGRWFACWQNWDKEYRNKILLDDMETGMLDYHACCLQILYGLDRLPFLRNRNSYQLEEYSRNVIGQRNAAYVREIIKTVTLIILNVRSIGGAKRAVNSMFNPTEYDLPYQIEKKKKLSRCWDRLNLSTDLLIDRILEKHESIATNFFTGIGLKVMNYESKITSFIYNRFIENNMPILGYHDGYLVKLSDIEYLRECMEEGFRVVVNTRKNHRVIIKREF